MCFISSHLYYCVGMITDNDTSAV